jgi:Domain of unknown function (DUF6398)
VYTVNPRRRTTRLRRIPCQRYLSMSTLSVPNRLKPPFDAVVGITDAVCRTHLPRSAARSRENWRAALARKRPSPLVQGRPDTSACGVTHTICTVNFLFDPSSFVHRQKWWSVFTAFQRASAAQRPRVVNAWVGASFGAQH